MTTLPTIDAVALLPVLAPALGAVLVLLLDALAPRAGRLLDWVAGASLVAGLGTARPWQGRLPVETLCLDRVDGPCLYTADRLSSGLQVAVLAAALVAVLLGVGVEPPAEGRDGRAPGAAFPAVPLALLLTATAGGAALAAAGDLPSVLVALELAALPVVLLVALRDTRGSVVAASDLLLSSLAGTAVAAVGAAAWLAATGSLVLSVESVGAARASGMWPVLVLAVLLLMAALGVKLALAPFHGWAPQVYREATPAAVAVLAGVSKLSALAGVVAVLRPLVRSGAPVVEGVVAVACASMVWGSLALLRTRSAAGLLAWSAVAQAGWMLLPAATGRADGLEGSVVYGIVTALATLALVAVLAVVVPDWSGRGADDAGLLGLGHRAPVLGLAAGLALLSLAGLPPAVGGLVVKIAVLRSLVEAGLWLPLAVAVVSLLLGVAAYTRWLGRIVRRPGPAAVTARPEPRSAAASAALTSLLVALVAVSVVPGLVHLLVAA